MIDPPPTARPSRTRHRRRPRTALLLAGALAVLGPTGVLGQPAAATYPDPTTDPDTLRWRTVSAGWDLSCGITVDGVAWCWSADVAAPVDPTQTWTSVSAGADHACGLRADGSLWCWGHNEHGQLGDGGTADHSDPRQVAPGTRWTAVTAGPMHSCGVRLDATLWCWGWWASVRSPDQDRTEVSPWGEYSPDEERTFLPVPEPADPDVLIPSQLGAPVSWRTVTSGARTTCAIDTTDALWCWGFIPGDRHSWLSLDITRVGTGTGWAAVSPGALMLARRADGTVWTWERDSHVPALGDTPTVATAMSAGVSHQCLVLADGSLTCWGWNSSGQLGAGPSGYHEQPVTVAPGTTWAEVSAGHGHSCGIRTDRTLWCWGDNSHGQLRGDGTTTDSTVPVHVQLR